MRHTLQASHTNHNVLISGASSGIGLCCAQFLARQGMRVFAGYRNPCDGARLSTLHKNIVPLSLTVDCAESISTALNRVTAQCTQTGGLHALINNAGIAVGGPVEYIDLNDWRQQLEVNLIGVVALTQHCLPLLRQTQGRIINIGSVAGIMALPFLSPYAISKSGLAILSDALRVELKPWGIQVALIEPGNINTPIWDKSLANLRNARQAYPPGSLSLYGATLEKITAASQQAAMKSQDAEIVAKAVYNALTAREAKTRYALGAEVRLRRFLALLPDGWRDWLISQKLSI